MVSLVRFDPSFSYLTLKRTVLGVAAAL